MCMGGVSRGLPRNGAGFAGWVVRVLAVGVLCVISALLPGNATPAWAENLWGWPVAGAHHIGRGFDRPAHNWLPGHRGVDVPAREGTQVLSAGAGTITFASELAGRGVVVVSHGTLRTTYEPVQASVSVGQVVRRGQVIGVLATGVSHCSTATTVTCLHWGLRRGREYLNPLSLVRVRLLPLYAVH